MSLALLPDLRLDVLTDGQLDGALTNLSQVGTGEALRDSGQVVDVDLFGDRGLPQVGAKNGDSAGLVRKWNVDQLIETARTEDGGVDDVRPGNRSSQDSNRKPHLNDKLT